MNKQKVKVTLFVLYLNLGFLFLIHKSKVCSFYIESIIRTQKIVCIVQNLIFIQIFTIVMWPRASFLHTRSTSVNKSAIAKIIFICLPLFALKTMKNLFEIRHYFFFNQCRNFLSMCFCNWFILKMNSDIFSWRGWYYE